MDEDEEGANKTWICPFLRSFSLPEMLFYVFLGAFPATASRLRPLSARSSKGVPFQNWATGFVGVAHYRKSTRTLMCDPVHPLLIPYNRLRVEQADAGSLAATLIP